MNKAVTDEMDDITRRAMKDFGFDNIDNLSRFDLLKLGINYGIKHQLEKELANLRGGQ